MYQHDVKERKTEITNQQKEKEIPIKKATFKGIKFKIKAEKIIYFTFYLMIN